METREIKSGHQKCHKKAELKQRFFNAFNPLYIPGGGDTKTPESASSSPTSSANKKENKLLKFSEKCLDKLKLQTTSAFNEPVLNSYQIATKDSSSVLQQQKQQQIQQQNQDKFNLIKPVALRPKISNTFSTLNSIHKRNSVDYLSQHEPSIDTTHGSYFKSHAYHGVSYDSNANVTSNACTRHNQMSSEAPLVFANRTNRNSRFIDRRSMNRLSMNHSTTSMLEFNLDNIQQKEPSNAHLG